MSDQVEPTIIEHNGERYVFDYSKDTKAEVEFVGDFTEPHYNVFYHYRLTGAHEGPPIDIVVKNPRPELDEDGGWGMEWDGIYFKDDRSEFQSPNGDLEDNYFDALIADLNDMDWRA
jgi:hypothetical protein